MSQEAADTLNATWTEGWPKIVAKAWSDASYKAELMADPKAVIAAAGLPVIDGIEIQVVDGSGSPKMVLSIPDAPEDAEGQNLEGSTGELSQTETSCCC